ncbi:MAG: mechanosensitive ion channel family protein [Candidatus Palauibacterales bacterium]|nr:mechanosensitive ion channel family protein [Candidatus Palauibacterales bacterium]
MSFGLYLPQGLLGMHILGGLQTPTQVAQEGASQLSGAVGRLWDAILSGGSLEKVVIFFLVFGALYALSRVTRRSINRQIEDVKRRHELRKIVNYIFWIALAVAGVALFAEQLDLKDLGTVLGLIAAAITIALSDVIRSLAGWVYVSSRRGVEIGSRVEVEGVKGDVIDIGLLKTTLLEVGEPLVHGLQSTGRLVTVPNSVFLGKTVFASASENPLVWQELQILVTFESDWASAREILRGTADELYQEILPDLKASFEHLERRYAFRLGSTAPIVYTTIADSGVLLTLRYLTFVRRRRSTSDRISTAVLDRFEKDERIEFAYPTYRLFRHGEELSGGPGTPGSS